MTLLPPFDSVRRPQIRASQPKAANASAGQHGPPQPSNHEFGPNLTKVIIAAIIGFVIITLAVITGFVLLASHQAGTAATPPASGTHNKCHSECPQDGSQGVFFNVQLPSKSE
jgi:hypothetical protein